MRTRPRTRLDGLVAGMTPLPADEVGDEDDEDQPCQGSANGNGDQHVVTILHTLFHCNKDSPVYALQGHPPHPLVPEGKRMRPGEG